MSYKLRRPFTYLLSCFLVFFVVAQGYASGFVLCIGADHSAIEQAFTDKCGSAESFCSTEAELACEHDHCGPCRDIETSFESLQANYRNHLAAPPSCQPALCGFFSIIPEHHGYLTEQHLAQPPPPYSYFLATIRTTVLLI